MMDYLNCKSYAKLNSCLHVINKRNDGYHNIESIFYTIDLYDKLTFKKNNLQKIYFNSNSDHINTKTNLVVDAFDIMFREYSDVTGLDVYLDKVIPIGSGLGGGSSNAAVTLMSINKMFDLSLPDNVLKDYALQIGSDVPFFIEGGSACVQGRGEIIQKIQHEKKYFIIILSDLSISTREIFEELDPDCFLPKCSHSDLITSQFNSLEEVVLSKYPELMATKYWLSTFGSVRMSGTGSTLYIEFNNHESALKANKEISQKYKSIVVSSLESYENFS